MPNTSEVLESLLRLAESAGRFSDGTSLMCLRESTIQEVSQIHAALLDLKRQDDAITDLSAKLRGYLDQVGEIKSRIDRILKNPDPEVSHFREMLQNDLVQLDEQAKGCEDFRELKEIMDTSRRTLENVIGILPAMDDVYRQTKAWMDMNTMALTLYHLKEYYIRTYKLKGMRTRMSMLRKFRVKRVVETLRKDVRTQRELLESDKFTWTLKLIDKLLNLVPTKLQLLIALLQTRKFVVSAEIKTEEDLKALLALREDIMILRDSANEEVACHRDLNAAIESLLAR